MIDNPWEKWKQERENLAPIWLMHRLNGAQAGKCQGCRFLEVVKHRSGYRNGYDAFWTTLRCSRFPFWLGRRPRWRKDYQACGLKESS